MMTQTDFQALAEALGSADDLHDAVVRIATACAASNPRFNRPRFYAAVHHAQEKGRTIR